MMEKFPKLVTDIKPQFQEAESIKQEKCKKTNKQTHTKKPQKTHFQEYHIKAAENQRKENS